MKKIFAYWQSNNEMPGYLQLCIDTWYKAVPNLEVHFINHSNIEKYLGDIYHLDNLKRLSYAKQSDAVSVALLEKYGGLFIDIDTILIGDVIRLFDRYDPNKLLAFGNPLTGGVHIAVLYCQTPNNPILREWRVEIQKRLINFIEPNPWDYMGNSILEPLLKNADYKKYYEIIDRLEVGNILEAKLIKGKNAINAYKELYFECNTNISILNVLNMAKYGIVSLHNSWTPSNFSSLTSSQFFTSNVFLSHLLKFILKDELFENLSSFFDKVFDAIFDMNFYSFNRIWSKKLFVVDFLENNTNFAFDFGISNEGYLLDVVMRSTSGLALLDSLDLERLTPNKIRLGSYDNFNDLMLYFKIYLSYFLIKSNQYKINNPIKIYLSRSIYTNIKIDSKILSVSLNLISEKLLIYFKDVKSSINSVLGDIFISHGFLLTENMYCYDTSKFTPSEKCDLFFKFINMVFDFYYPNRSRVIVGNYIDVINNNSIESPRLKECTVSFKGRNNKLVIANNNASSRIHFDFKGNESLVYVSNNTHLKGEVRLGEKCEVFIGENTTSTNPVYFTCAEETKLMIGKDCMFATGNQIRTDDAHPIYCSKTGVRINHSKDIIIGDHVWIGYGSVILSGSIIGNGSIIGMGAIVKGKFSNNCIIAGVPAKVVKENVFWERPLLLSNNVIEEYSSDDLANKYYCNLTE